MVKVPKHLRYPEIDIIIVNANGPNETNKITTSVCTRLRIKHQEVWYLVDFLNEYHSLSKAEIPKCAAAFNQSLYLFQMFGKITPEEWEGELDFPPNKFTEFFNHNIKQTTHNE